MRLEIFIYTSGKNSEENHMVLQYFFISSTPERILKAFFFSEKKNFFWENVSLEVLIAGKVKSLPTDAIWC